MLLRAGDDLLLLENVLKLIINRFCTETKLTYHSVPEKVLAFIIDVSDHQQKRILSYCTGADVISIQSVLS